jgi:murein DD-endopeptidase MepM/ murein hydrolase activator NlpD
MRAAEGTKVFASHDGFVKLEEDQGDKGYGLHLRLHGEDGSKKFETEYAHLSKTSVHKGQQVKAGQLIGLSGNTGFSTAAHLHWGLRFLDPNGNPIAISNGYKGWVDPAQFAVEKLEPKVADLSDWQKNAIAWIQMTGISQGSRPLDQITRVEVFELLRKYHEYLKSLST